MSSPDGATSTLASTLSTDDVDFYQEVLRDMRARREEEAAVRRKQRSWELDSSSGTAATELSESASSFLSWASSSQSQQQDSEELHSSYWHDRLKGTLTLNSDTSGPLPDFFARLTRSPSSTIPEPPAFQRRCSDIEFGEYAESARQLQYTREDLQLLAFGDTNDFHKLQKSLRKEGACTNELLKQVLPMVVAQCQQRRKAKQKLVEQQRQQALEKILEMEPDEPEEATTTDHSRRGKSPLHKAFSFLVEEKKEE